MTGYWETQLAAARKDGGMNRNTSSPRTGHDLAAFLRSGAARKLTDAEMQIVQQARAHYLSDKEFASAMHSGKETIKRLLDGVGAMKATADRVVACSKMIVKQAGKK